MLLTIVLTVACVGLFFMFSGVEAKAEQAPVEYVSYNEGTGTFESLSCSDYVAVTSADSLEMTDGKWYVFDGTVEINNRVTVSGAANIILKNGCTFTASKGIKVASGSSLTIYGQTTNGTTATLGKLVAYGEENLAGIGCNRFETAGSITINGGVVMATGGEYGAGIGGGSESRPGVGGSITINGGEVTANGGKWAAGIGGGCYGGVRDITIKRGEVTATGGQYGAGIGGGDQGNIGTITIYGGGVTANGGEKGAGIGGGRHNGSTGIGEGVTINGGEVIATGGEQGSGIGSGSEGIWEDITINGGKVIATGGEDGAGIGSGYKGYEGNFTINGGEVIATGGEQGSGIGDGYRANRHGTYTLGSGMKWYASGSEASGYGEITGSGTFGEIKRYAIVYRENSAFMTASNNTITAKYIEGGEKKTINLTLYSSLKILYGDDSTARAKLEGLGDFNSKLGRPENERVSESQIQYYKRNGQPLGGAPTAKGEYYATITVDGVTAKIDYIITKDDPVISAPVANNLTYTGTEQALITRGSTTGGAIKYSLSETGTFDTEVPKGKEAKTYKVYYKVEGDNSIKDSITYCISVEIRKASLNLSLTQSGWAKGGQMPLPVLNGNSGNGTVTYLYKKYTEDDSAYSDNIPTEIGDYIIKATVAETGNYLGSTTTAEFTISEPDPSQSNTGTSTNKNSESVADKASEVPEPSIFSRKNKDGSETKIEIVWNADGTTTVINENKQADGTTVVKEETRDAKGNGTSKIEKKDADGNLLSSTKGTIGVNKKGTETIKSTTKNADGLVSEKTQKTYKRDPNADNIKKVTTTEKKTDAAGNTETIKTTAFVGVLGDATITEKSTYKGVGADEKTAVTVKEERQYSLSVNGRLKLMSLTSDSEKVTIPENIELDGMTRVVKAIGKNALKGNKTVKEVVLGENITTICTGAFKNCKNLELIELAGSVKKIYKNAFKGIAKNAKFVIAASEEDFERIVELIKKSGVSDTVTFERV